MSHERDEDLPLLMTVEQVAALLQLHPETVRQQIRQGVLPARKYGKNWRVLRDDILRPQRHGTDSDKPQNPPARARSATDQGAAEQYVTHLEAARLLGCSRATISRMLDRGELTAEPRGARGGARRIRRDTLLDHLAARTTPQ